MAEELGLRVPASRAGDAEDVRRDAAALRQLRQSARRHRRIYADIAARGGQGADRRSEHRHAVHLVSDQHRASWCRTSTRAWRAPTSPRCMVALGDTWPLGPDVMEAVKQSPAVFGRSSDRMMRAIALYTRYGRLLARPRGAAPARADQGPAQARQGHAAGMARQEGAGGRRHPRARWRARPHRRRGGRGRQAHRLSGGAEGAGRGAVAQDRGRRRDAEPRRRSGAARRLGHA